MRFSMEEELQFNVCGPGNGCRNFVHPFRIICVVSCVPVASRRASDVGKQLCTLRYVFGTLHAVVHGQCHVTLAKPTFTYTRLGTPITHPGNKGTRTSSFQWVERKEWRGERQGQQQRTENTARHNKRENDCAYVRVYYTV